MAASPGPMPRPWAADDPAAPPDVDPPAGSIPRACSAAWTAPLAAPTAAPVSTSPSTFLARVARRGWRAADLRDVVLPATVLRAADVLPLADAVARPLLVIPPDLDFLAPVVL